MNARASRRRARSRTSARSASSASGSSARRNACCDERLAAAVEHEHGSADQRRQRAGQRLEPALGEHDPLQPLLRGQRTPQHRVLLVDELRERRLGDRDERHLVRDLEHRELALGRDLEQRLRHRRVPEAGAEPEPGQLVVGQPRDELALRSGVSSCMPVVSSTSPPDSHGVGSSSSEMWTQRTGRSRPRSPASRRTSRSRSRSRDGQHLLERPSRLAVGVPTVDWPWTCIRSPASVSTGRRIASISSNCSGPAISGGDSWITGSPRSSARQIRPRR